MLPPQLHNTTADALIIPDRLVIESGSMKPLGAFWTSTYNGFSSSWLEWCEIEMPEWVKPYNFVLTVDPSAKVYVINSLEDLEQLVAMYPYGGFMSQYLTYIDWAAMANEGWDGIQVTEAGQWATRYSNPGLNGWDCESTAWFRWVFTSVERI
jgi:hypothetical protein